MAETFTSRFAVYPKEIVQFIEYCKRFNILHQTEIKFAPPSYNKIDEDEPEQLTQELFVCDVTLFSEMDSLRFINVFSLFFKESKYCIRV